MSTEDGTTRKAKKAQRDAERKKAGKKRKRDEVEEQSPGGQDELKSDFVSLAGGDETKVAKDLTTSSKKRKSAEASTTEQDAAPEEAAAPTPKKRRKSKPTAAAANGDAADGANAEAATATDDASSTKPTKSRFILFIGNLPFTATDAGITAHFHSIQPFTLRHRVDKQTKKSKGFAFLEFENYDRMKTCLKLYHHSTFDPAAHDGGTAGPDEAAKGGGGRKSKRDKSRRINVELTAGGGGKGGDRTEKIKVKNARLEEERKRRREAEEKEALRKEKKLGMKKRTGANAAPAGKAAKEGHGEGVEEGGDGEGMQGVHPTRRARMKT